MTIRPASNLDQSFYLNARGILAPEEVQSSLGSSENVAVLNFFNVIRKQIIISIDSRLLNQSGFPWRFNENPLSSLSDIDVMRTWLNAHSPLLNRVKELNFNGIGLTRVPKELILFIGVEELFLSENNLTEIEPDAFLGLNQLKSLWLCHNLIRELPSDLFREQIRLESLDLSQNCLEEIPCDLLKPLTCIKNLFFQQNKIKELHPELFAGKVQLVQIILSRNCLSSIPSELFQGLGELLKVELNGNEIEHLPNDLFNSAKKLRYFYIACNGLKEIPPGLFKELENLQRIMVQNNQLKEPPCDLYLLPLLERIFLSGNPLTSMFCKDVANFDFYSTEDFERISKEFCAYPCKSQLSQFYQYAMTSYGQYDGGVIKFFYTLDDTVINAMSEMVHTEAGSPALPADDSKGEHIFDDMSIFLIALRKLILQQFKDLTEAERNAVYEQTHVLAMEEQVAEQGFVGVDLSDPQWGAVHFEDNILRLIDAMGRLEL